MSASGEPGAPSAETLHLAYAEASVFLIEALLHLLVERKVIPLDELIATLETAVESKRTLARQGHSARISDIAAGVLSTIANSIAAGSPREY